MRTSTGTPAASAARYERAVGARSELGQQVIGADWHGYSPLRPVGAATVREGGGILAPLPLPHGRGSDEWKNCAVSSTSFSHP